jgi:Ca2+-binding RTX toxin-like protein
MSALTGLLKHLFAPPVSPRRQAPRAKLAVEPLEGRDLLAASLAGGVLTVTGTQHNDTIRVSRNGGTIWVEESYDAGGFGGTGVSSYVASQVSKVVINGYDGNDSLNMHGVSAAGEISGGRGNDSLYGGLLADKVYGGENNDLIYGNEGNDTLDGWLGNDSLYGYTGDDVLYGGEGNDSLKGNDGRDVLYGYSGNDTLIGTAGADQLNGWTGNDRMEVTLDLDDLIDNRGRAIAASNNFQAGNGTDSVVVTLDLDSFGRRFLKPLTDEVSRMTHAMQPVLDLLARPVPFLSQFDGSLTFGSILSRQNPNVGAFIDRVRTIRGFANSVGTWSGQIALGTFTVASGSRPAVATVSANPLPQINSSLLPRLKSAGFSLGLLDNPASAVELMLGRNVSLFEVTLPALTVGASFSNRWNIPTGFSFGGAGAYVTATVGGSLNLRAGATVGMDAKGVFSGWVYDGLYLRNAYASVTASLTAGAGVAVGVASVWELASTSLNGGVSGTLTFTLPDPNRDGKTHFAELPSTYSQSFRRSGSISYGVWGTLKYWDFAAFRNRWQNWEFYRGTLKV